VVIRRWQLFTGKPALFGATGTTFEELAERRKTKLKTSAATPANRGAQS
jgi:hypothetical protein